jgi:hypothetical protein
MKLLSMHASFLFPCDLQRILMQESENKMKASKITFLLDVQPETLDSGLKPEPEDFED